jgi:2-oxoglutarate dehydrogenase complex dehydrogenase (E1) component-like enzyme
LITAGQPRGRGTVLDVTDTVAQPAEGSPDFGANSWLVEEMYEQFRQDPSLVGESWREFFSDY